MALPHVQNRVFGGRSGEALEGSGRVQEKGAEQRALAISEARPKLLVGGWRRIDAIGLPKAKARSMILTQCAVCATQLGLSLGKKCGRCSTRYCGAACQVQHWKEGGHDKLCKKIKRAGGAEQYHADTKYSEAVTVAAEACAEDTKGQTCYICTQALHWKPKEGLVRGCSCRGTAGFAHVSCLVEQVKILLAEAEENNLGVKALDERWRRWHECSLCEQRHHGAVKCALGWACWKTYLGRQETDQVRCMAINVLGLCLHDAGHYEEALLVKEAELSAMRRLGGSEADILLAQGNLATTYRAVGRREEALRMLQEVYSGYLRGLGEEHNETLRVANSYAAALHDLQRFEEARTLLRQAMPVARRVLGESHELTLMMRWNYARAFYDNPDAALNDLREAVTMVEDTERIARRVLGSAHPTTESIEVALRNARAVFRVRASK